MHMDAGSILITSHCESSSQITYKRTNGPVNAHLISGATVTVNVQNRVSQNLTCLKVGQDQLGFIIYINFFFLILFFLFTICFNTQNIHIFK